MLQKVKIQVQLKKVAFVAFKKLKFKFKQRCKRKIKIYIAYTKIICYQKGRKLINNTSMYYLFFKAFHAVEMGFSCRKKDKKGAM